MVTKEYAIALAEVNDILKISTSDVRTRIPYKFRKYIIQNMDKTHHTSIDISKSIDNQSISNEAKNIIALIYRDYLTSDTEKQELLFQELSAKENYEIKLKELYNPNNMFNKKISPSTDSLELSVIDKKNFINKLFDYIKSFFNKK